MKKINLLAETLVPPENNDSSRLMDCFLKSYKQLIKDGEKIAPTEAFPALFDFVVSAEYARLMAANVGWVYCKGSDSLKPSLYFPYLKTCPRCSVGMGERPKATSNKPTSSHIGDISSNTTFLIMSKILQYNRPTSKIFKSTDRQGDVDLVIKDDNLIALIEIKSSPLVVYPMHIQLSYPMTVVINGEHSLLDDHSPVSAQVRKENINLYLPHMNTTISVGNYDTDRWPYPQLITYVSQKDNVRFLIDAWNDLNKLYENGWGSNRGVDNRRWIICGCGGGVDDSKNAPGIDRTDDIKKGTYQVLKLGAEYKEVSTGNVLTILASNFFAHRKSERYIDNIKDVLWTKPKHEIEPGEYSSMNIRAFDRDGVFNLFDAIFCFTKSVIQNKAAEHLLGWDRFLEKFNVD